MRCMRSMVDPYAPKKSVWWRVFFVLLVLGAFFGVMLRWVRSMSEEEIARISNEMLGVLAALHRGSLLDRAAGTSPWFSLIGFAVGLAAGILNVVRTMRAVSGDSTRGN